MTFEQEMAKTLFDKTTLSKAKQQFKDGEQKVRVDAPSANLRLIKRPFGNINLELLCRDDSGMYFKPIGFYEFEKGGWLSSGKLSITILNEFQTAYKELKDKNQLDDNGVQVKFMDIKENGVIAAFSRETIETVKIMYRQKKQGVSKEIAELIGPFPHLHAMQFDKSLISNGLKLDLLFSMDGFPQSYLDDKYNVQGGFGAYFQNANGLSLNPIVEHKNNFDKFSKMGLLSAFNTD